MYIRTYVCRYLQTTLPLVDFSAPAYQRQCACIVCVVCVCVLRVCDVYVVFAGLVYVCTYTYRHFGHGAAFRCPLALQVCSLLENRLEEI